MKSTIPLVFLLGGQILFAQSQVLPPNQITVVGSAEYKVKANQATFYFSVKGVGSTLRLAVEQANAKTSDIISKLLALGIKRTDLSTSQFYSGENTGDRAFLSSSRDFKASLTTMVKLDSLDLMQPALFLISEQAVESLSEISFSLSTEPEYRRRARLDAALNAKDKAEELAKVLGVTIEKPILIEEQVNQMFIRGGRAYPSPFNTSTIESVERVSVSSSESGFIAQTISVTSQVRVVFQIK